MPSGFPSTWAKFVDEIANRFNGALERKRLPFQVECVAIGFNEDARRAICKAFLRVMGLEWDALLLLFSWEVLSPEFNILRICFKVCVPSLWGLFTLYRYEVRSMEPLLRENEIAVFNWKLKNISTKVVDAVVDWLGECSRKPDKFEEILKWKGDFMKGFKEGVDAVKEGWDLRACWLEQTDDFEAQIVVVFSHPQVGERKVSFPFRFISHYQKWESCCGAVLNPLYPFQVALMYDVWLHFFQEICALLTIKWVPEVFYASFNPVALVGKSGRENVGGDNAKDVGKRVGEMVARQLNVTLSGAAAPAQVSIPNPIFKFCLLNHFRFLVAVNAIIGAEIMRRIPRRAGRVEVLIREGEIDVAEVFADHSAVATLPKRLKFSKDGSMEIIVRGVCQASTFYKPCVEIHAYPRRVAWIYDDAIHHESPSHVVRSKLKDALKKFREFFLANFAMER